MCVCALNEYQKLLLKKRTSRFMKQCSKKCVCVSSGSASPRRAAAHTHQVEVPLKDLQAP